MLENKKNELKENFDSISVGLESFDEVFEAFEELWKSFDDAIKKQSKNPKISYVVGQPGAGKTSLREYVLKRQNMILINGDDYRKFHPNHAKLILEPETYEIKTRAFKNLLIQLLIAKCLDEKVSFLLENTFMDILSVNKTISNAKDNNFDIEINVLDVPIDESWISANYRMLEMKKKGEAIRNVDLEAYLKSYKIIQKVIEQANKKSTYFPDISSDKIKIFTREKILSEENPKKLTLDLNEDFKEPISVSPRSINVKRMALQELMVLSKLKKQESKELSGITIHPEKKIPTTSKQFKREIDYFKKMLIKNKKEEKNINSL